MDPNTSIRQLCLVVDNRVSLNDRFEREGQWEGPEYEDTADSGKKKKDTKSFTFYRMETEEINQQYITPCFVDGLHAYDGEINLGEKVMKKELVVALRGELYFVRFFINPEEDDVEPGVMFGRSFLRLTKGIVDFRTGIITIYPDIITFNDDSDDELDVILASIDVIDLPPLDITDILPFIDKHKKLLNNVLLEKLKLDGELELEEEANEEMVTSYKAIKEKKDPKVFVLPIRLEAKFDFYALADTGSNINVIPYYIYDKSGRENVKPLEHTMMMPVLPDPKELVNTKSWKKLCSHVFIMIFCSGEREIEECLRLRFMKWEDMKRYSVLKLGDEPLTSTSLSTPSCVTSFIPPTSLTR
uniref:Reverse transcriptase domain-containing protein n=1 Tax=Tanacetum cinerariifolium TaxID=118510 RepID=A0A699HGY7_TANCI|nr:hypothetical protein [Tanacetum cinerariifolium]